MTGGFLAGGALVDATPSPTADRMEARAGTGAFVYDDKAPETFTGDLVSDLNGKRAHVLGISPEDHATVIDAQAPLAEMQRYATDLRSLTQGRATFSIAFDHYAEVPDHVAKKVIEAAAKSASWEHH